MNRFLITILLLTITFFSKSQTVLNFRDIIDTLNCKKYFFDSNIIAIETNYIKKCRLKLRSENFRFVQLEKYNNYTLFFILIDEFAKITKDKGVYVGSNFYLYSEVEKKGIYFNFSESCLIKANSKSSIITFKLSLDLLRSSFIACDSLTIPKFCVQINSPKNWREVGLQKAVCTFSYKNLINKKQQSEYLYNFDLKTVSINVIFEKVFLKKYNEFMFLNNNLFLKEFPWCQLPTVLSLPPTVRSLQKKVSILRVKRSALRIGK